MIDTKPHLDEDLLVHFGVRGMHWGQRKETSSGNAPSGSSNNKRMSTKKKVAIGAGVAVGVAGAAAVAYMMSRRGKVSVRQVMGNRPGLSSPGTAASRGKRAVGDISQSEWRKRVADLRSDMANANAEQDSWMRRQGLGAVLNRG